MAAPNTFSGPRARLTAAGVIVGYAADVSGNENYQYDEVDCIGVLEVQEYVVVGYRASFQARIFRLIGRSLKALGIYPTLGAVLTSGDISVGIEDTVTGEVPYQFIGAKCADKNFNGNARSVFAEDTSWVCTRILDESENAA